MTVKRHRSSHPPRLRNAPLPTGRSAAGVRQRYVGAPPRTPVPRRRPAQGKRRNAVARSGGGWVAAKAQTCCDGFVAPQWGAGVTSGAPTFGGWSCGGGWRFSGRPGWRPYVWQRNNPPRQPGVLKNAPTGTQALPDPASKGGASGVTPLRLAGGLAAVVGGFPGVRGGAPTFGGWICGGCPAGWMVSPAERRQNFMKPGAGRCIPAMTRLSVRASCKIRLRATRASAGFMS